MRFHLKTHRFRYVFTLRPHCNGRKRRSSFSETKTFENAFESGEIWKRIDRFAVDGWWLHENGAFQKRCRHNHARFLAKTSTPLSKHELNKKTSYQKNFSSSKQYLRQQNTKVTTVWALVTKVSFSRLLDRFQKRISVDGWKRSEKKKYKNVSVDASFLLRFHKVKTMRFQKHISVVQA